MQYAPGGGGGGLNCEAKAQVLIVTPPPPLFFLEVGHKGGGGGGGGGVTAGQYCTYQTLPHLLPHLRHIQTGTTFRSATTTYKPSIQRMSYGHLKDKERDLLD